MEAKIQLKKRDILKVEIVDENNKPTGEWLEFDVEDVGLPLRYQRAQDEHVRNLNFIKTSFMLIDKKPDHTGKKLLTRNEEEKYRKLEEFYKKEEEALDLVIGKGGTRKLLNGAEPYYEMFEDIMEYLEPISPYITAKFEELDKKMKQKVKDRINTEESGNVIEG